MVRRRENCPWIIAGDHVFDYNVGDGSLGILDENGVMSHA
jgi:hypothetical protein